MQDVSCKSIMFKVKRARSVIHSVAHHGVSALSWLHPRLGEESKSQKVQEISYDFCVSKVTTGGFEPSTETEKAFSALQETFERIGSTEKVFLSQLSNASITFGFFNGRWPNYCICSVTSIDGKNVKVKVDGFGKKYGLLSKFRSYS